MKKRLATCGGEVPRGVEVEAGDGAEAVVGDVLRLCHELPTGVVEQEVAGIDPRKHLVDLLGFAKVGGRGADQIRCELGGLGERFRSSAHHRHVGAEWASRCAVARPMPEPPPVIRAWRPCMKPGAKTDTASGDVGTMRWNLPTYWLRTRP
jgi:hypothetical protein